MNARHVEHRVDLSLLVMLVLWIVATALISTRASAMMEIATATLETESASAQLPRPGG